MEIQKEYIIRHEISKYNFCGCGHLTGKQAKKKRKINQKIPF